MIAIAAKPYRASPDAALSGSSRLNMSPCGVKDRHLLDTVEQPEARGAMMGATGRRAKIVLFQSKSVPVMPGHSQSDFQIYASYRGSLSSGFYGTLKVVRKTDGRLLYPFDGAPDIGPFSTSTGAVAAAQQRGIAIVDGDLARPEL
jgi:hypothetical protein